jgi:prepilin-type N-terminal cleavage/methylation domain-containing protein
VRPFLGINMTDRSAHLIRRRSPAAAGRSAGFSMIELLVVVGLIGVTAAITLMVMPGAVKSARADSGLERVGSVLRTAREQAISQRRLVRVAFTGTNQITVSRIEVRQASTGTTPAPTVLSTVWLEDGIEFRTFAELPDTPDAFGNASAASFGSATTVDFTSEGSFVDQNGDQVNGTVFLGRYGDPLSGRAVSIFGPTALIREWRWDGRKWTN